MVCMCCLKFEGIQATLIPSSCFSAFQKNTSRKQILLIGYLKWALLTKSLPVRTQGDKQAVKRDVFRIANAICTCSQLSASGRKDADKSAQAQSGQIPRVHPALGCSVMSHKSLKILLGATAHNKLTK